MRKTIIALAIAAILIVGAILLGFPTTGQKKHAAMTNVQTAQFNLNVERNNAFDQEQKKVLTKKLSTDILESKTTIKDNEIRIAALYFKIDNSGKGMDEFYKNKIGQLEMKNISLRKTIVENEKKQSYWMKIKRLFNDQVDESGSGSSKFIVDNLK